MPESTTQPTLEQELAAALIEVQWSAEGADEDGRYYPACPRCGGGDPDYVTTPVIYAGHEDYCTLAKALWRFYEAAPCSPDWMEEQSLEDLRRHRATYSAAGATWEVGEIDREIDARDLLARIYAGGPLFSPALPVPPGEH